MNRRIRKSCLALAVVAVASGLASEVRADEKTGREFRELVNSVNQNLSTAKDKIKAIELRRESQRKANPVKVLPARAAALRELEKLSKQFDQAKLPEEKEALSNQIENQVLKVTELGTDFLESMKNDLISQDTQLEIVEESLSDVVMKMGKLQNLAQKSESGASPELENFQARKSLYNLAQTVELFAGKHRDAQQWEAIRRTIMLQDAILRRSNLATDKIQELLSAQKKLYEQVLAQVVIARRSLQGEKEILAQVGLGEIAKSMLRKAAGLLLGNQSITQLGEVAFLKSEERQQQVLNFLEQDQDSGLYNGLNSGKSSPDTVGGFPSGYKAYLANGIQ